MSRLPYGYIREKDGIISVNEPEALVVKEIYKQYLAGNSSGSIVAILTERQIPSPSNNGRWNRTAVDNILSNGKYLSQIINLEQFFEVQYEKQRRSNINHDIGKRKTARYNSQNVLSGLLICAGCGASYRRITRGNGNIVWRCGSRVEHGNKICETSPTISDKVIKAQLCKELEMFDFDPQIIRKSINCVFVESDSRLTSVHKNISSMNYSNFLI